MDHEIGGMKKSAGGPNEACILKIGMLNFTGNIRIWCESSTVICLNRWTR
jgi:hypothetical protein